MDWREHVRAHLTDITGDAARDADIIEELAQHLALRVQDARAEGLGEAEALERATRELRRGTLAAAIREADRPRPAAPSPPVTQGASIMRDVWQDVRYAIRLLIRNPGFTIASAATLVLGIGMTAAIFSVVNGVLLRPMPYPDADRLVMLWETDRASGTTKEPGSFPDLVDYRERSQTLDAIGAFVGFDANLEPDRGDPSRVAAIAATPEVFNLLGIRPLAGRALTPDDDRPGAPPTVLISERLWNAAYARDNVIGRTLRVMDSPRVIIGVLPTSADTGLAQMLLAADYGGAFASRDARTRVDVWMPIQGDARRFPRSTHPFLMLARRSSTATADAAQQELTGIAATLERQYPDNDRRGIFVEPMQQVVFGPVRPPLMLLMAAVGLVLLMACVNVINLLLARGTRRIREVAVRTALGAEMKRLVRQFIAENIVLTLGSGVAAIVLAYLALRVLTLLAPGDIPRLGDVGIEGRVLFGAFAVCSTIALLFSLVPILQVRRTQLQTALRAEDSYGATRGRHGQLLRSGLVVLEVALAVVLTASAGLLLKSFWQLRATDPGFEVAGVLKAEYQLPPSRYPIANNPNPTSPAIARLNEQLARRVAALPGVTSIAFAAEHPLDAGFASSFMIPGREAEAASWPEISIRRVSPGYFETLRVPLRAGRFFQDVDVAQRGVIINQTTADRFFTGQNPIGQQIGFWGQRWSIVGVIGNERFQGVAKDAPIAVYLPLDIVPSPAESLIVRSDGDMNALGSSVRAVIREIDPQLVVFGLEPLENALSQSLGEARFLMMLLVVFALLALVLAAVGIQGVLAFTVAERQREIGIRMALGADATRVLGAVVAQGAILTGLGLASGFALAFVSRGLLAGLLQGVTTPDAVTLVGIIAVLATAAALSVWVPARRAVRIDPLVILRPE